MLGKKYVLSKSTNDSMEVLLSGLLYINKVFDVTLSMSFIPIKATLKNYFCNVRVTGEIYKYRVGAYK